MTEITLKVGGMSCQGCVASVKKLLGAETGVAHAEVDLGQGEARVRFDPAVTDASRLVAILTDAGYPSHL
ncbi:MAG: heavy-metal-associated domain-containing protein [Pseudomonadota bacterium]